MKTLTAAALALAATAMFGQTNHYDGRAKFMASTTCYFAGKTIPCDPKAIPKMVIFQGGTCTRKEGVAYSSPGVFCADGVMYEEAQLAQPNDEVHHPTHPRDWTPAMCSKPAAKYVGEGYIAYCLKNAPTVTPACPAAPERPQYILNQNWRVLGAYYEPLDCKWHMGHDPRSAK